MEHLYILDKFLSPHWQDDIEDNQWLEVLHPFTGVKNLYVSRELTPSIAPALQELIGERVIEVLPAMQTSWRSSTHRDLSRKPLGSLSPRDSSPVTR
jgi:hypothetical protein